MKIKLYVLILLCFFAINGRAQYTVIKVIGKAINKTGKTIKSTDIISNDSDINWGKSDEEAMVYTICIGRGEKVFAHPKERDSKLNQVGSFVLNLNSASGQLAGKGSLMEL